MHRSPDGGKTWTNLTEKLTGLPEWGTIRMIEPSPFNAAAAYLVVDAHLLDDMHPYLYKTSDRGQTWKRLDGPLPQDIPLHVVREDPERKGLLYAGTERGVEYSPDDGTTWRSLQLNLPTVPVHDLRVTDGDLVLGTHGRSLWILDDLTPVRRWSSAMVDQPMELLPPRPATRWHYHGTIGTQGAGTNPPAGAVFSYWLKAKPKARPKIEVLDGNGKIIRTMGREPETDAASTDRPGGVAGEPPPGAEPDEEESTAREEEREEEEERPGRARRPQRLPDQPGLHRVVWDLRHEPARPITGARIDAGNPERGPLALPGRYTIKLLVDGKDATVPLELKPDPRVQVTATDLADQVQLAVAIRDDFNRLSDTVERLRSIRKQLQDRNPLLKGNAPAQPLVTAATALVAKLDVLEAKLHNPKAQVTYDILAQRGGAQLYSRLGWLYTMVLEGDGPPTQGMRESYGRLHDELAKLLDSFQALLDKELAELNRQARSLELPHVIVPEPRKNP